MLCIKRKVALTQVALSSTAPLLDHHCFHFQGHFPHYSFVVLRYKYRRSESKTMFLKRLFNAIFSYLILDSESSSLLLMSTISTLLQLPVLLELLLTFFFLGQPEMPFVYVKGLLSLRCITLVSSLMPLCKKHFLVESHLIT